MPDGSGGVLPGPSLESQIIFRLASLEAIMTTSLSNINEKLETLSKDFQHKDLNRATQIAALDAKLAAQKEAVDKRIEDNNREIHARVTKLEFFRTELIAKATAAAALVGFIWVVFGGAVKRLLGIE